MLRSKSQPFLIVFLFFILFYFGVEFAQTGSTSTKSDVYGFGVFLLELLTGKEASKLVADLTDGETLYEWVSVVGGGSNVCNWRMFRIKCPFLRRRKKKTPLCFFFLGLYFISLGKSQSPIERLCTEHTNAGWSKLETRSSQSYGCSNSSMYFMSAHHVYESEYKMNVSVCVWFYNYVCVCICMYCI